MSLSRESPEAFAKSLMSDQRQKAQENADTYYNEEYFENLGGPEAVIRTEFPAFAWKELYYGICPPVRQADLIYRRGDPYYEDRDLIVGLGKQIRDEMKHARIFSNIAEEFGAEADMVTWEAPDHPEGYYGKLVDAGYAGADHEQPHVVAAGFQCSTEIGASMQIHNLADYIADDYPNIATSLRDIASDEGDHGQVGLKIIKRWASPADYDRMEQVAHEKYVAIRDGLELGFERAADESG
jgi:hypothetical protein